MKRSLDLNLCTVDSATYESKDNDKTTEVTFTEHYVAGTVLSSLCALYHEILTATQRCYCFTDEETAA